MINRSTAPGAILALAVTGIMVLLSGCGPSPGPATDVGAPSVVPSTTETRLSESLTQAIEAAESILKVSPKDNDALLAAALAAEHLGQTEKAIQYYRRLQDATQEPEYHRKLAELQLTLNPTAASQSATRFFDQGGRDDRLRLWLIRHHVEKRETRAAFMLTERMPPPDDAASRDWLRDLCLRHALSHPPSSPESLSAIRRAAGYASLPSSVAETAALAFLAAGDAPAARDLMKAYSGPAHLVRARIAEQLGDPQDALAQRLKYFYAGGTDPRDLFLLMESLGRTPPARQVADHLWRSAVADTRTRLAAARLLASSYRATPDTAAEIKFLEEAKGLGDPALLDRLADLQRLVGNAKASLAALKSRYPSGIPDPSADLYVSTALSAGDPSEALRAADRVTLSALTTPTRRKLSDLLIGTAESEMSGDRPAAAKSAALRAARYRQDHRPPKILAKLSLREGDTSAALEHLASAIRLTPSDPEANYLAGSIHFGRFRWAEAKPHLQIAHAGRFPAEDLPLLLGRIHFSEKNQSMAYPLLSEYVQAKNRQVPPDVQELLGRAAQATGHPADAALWFERRLTTGDDDRISAEYLESLLASGQKAKALDVARRLVVKYPSSKPILEAASNAFDAPADSPPLLKTLEALTSIESDATQKAVIQRRLLDLKIRMGRIEEADAILASLLARFPDDAQLLTAAWNLRKGTPAADPILKRLAGIRSPSDPIQLIRARQLMDDENYSGALTVVRDYLSRKKDDADGFKLQAEIYTRMGNIPASAAATRALLALRPDASATEWLIRTNYDLALSALASGLPLDRAEPLYAETLKLLGSEGTYKDAHEVFGKVFARDPRTRPLAIDAFQRELRVTPDAGRRAQLAETLGRLYLDDGQLVLAKEMFSMSQSAGNTSPTFLRAYAGLLARLGEIDPAADRYRQLLKQSAYDRESNLFMARRSIGLGKYEAAIESLEALRAASAADSGVLDLLGFAYAATGRHADAAEALQKLVAQTSSGKYASRYADALYHAGRYKSALQEYRSLVASGGATSTDLRRAAELEQSHGNWRAAEEIILRLLSTGGTDRDRASLADVLRRMGDMALRQRNIAEASRTAERLLALNSNDPLAFVLMGRVKLMEGKPAAAVESFSRAASLAPNDARAILGLAEVELRQQRPVAAMDYARKALAIDSSLPEAYTVMGLAHQRQGDIRGAYAALKNALLHSKNQATAHIRMGDLFLQHAKYNVALEQYRRALEADPKSALAHQRNAVALHKLGFSENAMTELLKAIELDPSGVGLEASVLLSEIFVARGDVDRAREILESASAKPAAPPSVLFHLGEMARRSGELQKSIQFFRDALVTSYDPSFKYDVLNALGLALSSLGENDAAEKTFKEAAQLRPQRDAAFLNLSLLYRSRQNFSDAVEHARKAIVASPKHPEGYKLLGLIYYEAGQEKESLSAFRESLRLLPDQPDILTLVRSIEAVEPEEEGE